VSAVGGTASEAGRAARPSAPTAARARGLPAWWPLAALTLLAAALRIATLDVQGLWYDEAFTPVHVLHAGLSGTLHAVVHSENSPPLWYLLEWADSRVLGTGAIALRLPLALFGIAMVPVAWAIGRELACGPPAATPAGGMAGRRTAIACAALVAVNPLFVWYSQEARVYGLFALTASLALLTFLRLRSAPSGRRAAEFAIAGALALLTHYFAVFLLAPMAAILLLEHAAAPGVRRAALPALAVQGAVGAALIPLIAAQGGHGTQWIGRWPLSERLQAIPQYLLLGPSGEPLGHGIELLVALPVLAGMFTGLWFLLDRAAPAARPSTGATGATPDAARPGAPGVARGGADEAALTARGELLGARALALIVAGGVLIPLVLAAGGADYLAPRNLIGAMVPLTVLIALLTITPAAGRLGVALLVTTAVGFLALTIDVNLSPRLQRGDWRGVARALRTGAEPRAVTTVELGAAPLEYYLPGLRNLARGSTVPLREIDETGYAPLRRGAGQPPAPGFRLAARYNIHGLIVYRFIAPAPVPVTEAQMRREVITRAHPEVLVPRGLRAATAGY
jgi:hypothetical protein